ncbi:MAG: peptidase U34 [Chloroflexi bacterium]|nr:peptidase U34 [Chloroflexota bacterium]
MCDTLIATKLATASGIAIFGKNSDRHPNEGQQLVYIPAATHPPKSRVQCTYIDIPQARQTHAVLLSKPFWMWGAEMGVNEYGLVIGNEAVFSKIPANKKPALLGMDMLRAALERTTTPGDALHVIVELLEHYGQGGNCTHEGMLYYHNSFIIANANDAWVLETVDRQWAARQVKDVYSISNCLTIGDEWDFASQNLVEFAIQNKLINSAAAFDYAKDYSDTVLTKFGRGRNRRETTYCILDEQRGEITPESMMHTLRHHTAGKAFDPLNGMTGVDVCMHAGFGPIRVGQSTASMVVYLNKERPLIFASGTSAPCTGIFKPLWLDAPLPDFGVAPGASFNPESLFWNHERLHRSVLLNYSARLATFAEERDELEGIFVRGAMNLNKSSAKQRGDYAAQCLSESLAAEAEWLKRVEGVAPIRRSLLNRRAWDGFNKKAGMPRIN